MNRDNDEGMDKYGVDQSGDDCFEKHGSTGCPMCGAPGHTLIKHGQVTVCPTCGTEPFGQRGRDR